MKSSKEPGTYRPFEDLKGLLEGKRFKTASRQQEKDDTKGVDEPIPVERGMEESEDVLFEKAMSGVQPMEREPVQSERVSVNPGKASGVNEEAETLAKLKDLVCGGEGFIISDTPEYMEGIGYGVNPDIARRLHRGDFSIQGHIDLHGLRTWSAQEAFEQFLKEATLSGKKAVLVVHGRGLSSTAEPVLKAKVKEWLTCGPWRKWVVAFTSARACDGGAGATYVLLRQRPATKRQRRRPKDK
jgi:DNA-nicking Smr family endonuclease